MQEHKLNCCCYVKTFMEWFSLFSTVSFPRIFITAANPGLAYTKKNIFDSYTARIQNQSEKISFLASYLDNTFRSYVVLGYQVVE